MKKLTIVMMSLLLGGAGLMAQDDKKELSASEQKFVNKAAMGGMTEVAAGNLAKEMGTTNEIKDFGEMMVKDHSAANDKLKSIAQDRGMTLPTELDDKHDNAVKKLAGMSGAAFDKAFLAQMEKDHDKSIKLFKDAQSSVKDEDLKEFIDKTLPVLEKHKKHLAEVKEEKKEETKEPAQS